MREPPENPYTSPAIVNERVAEHTPTLTFSSSHRIASGVISLAIGIFAFAGYVAWGIADSYFIADQDHFRLVLAVSVFLSVVAAYWMFFALIAYKLVPRLINYAILGMSILAAVPACIFVCKFFA